MSEPTIETFEEEFEPLAFEDGHEDDTESES